ncbi:MAG: hypothetical protein D3914_15420 [Candidatus Electrothrix sp. LOE2]|nr:hypothetical protein [Candidatus Electrothrix sp. LOE2]
MTSDQSNLFSDAISWAEEFQYKSLLSVHRQWHMYRKWFFLYMRGDTVYQERFFRKQRKEIFRWALFHAKHENRIVCRGQCWGIQPTMD